MSAIEKAVSHHYGRLDMHNNKIENVSPPLLPNDVEIHGHTHTAIDIGAIPITDKNKANGIPTLSSDYYINNNYIPIFTEQIIVTEDVLSNKALETTHIVDITKPIEFIIFSTDGYRSLNLKNNFDYEIVDDIISWELTDLNTYLSIGDTIYLSYFKTTD